MMNPQPLTERQAQAYATLHAFRDREGRSAGWVEMESLLGVSGPAVVRRFVETLERKGWIRRAPHKSHGIEFLRPAEEALRSTTTAENGRACSILLG